jgi:hypothetical protein
LYRPAIAIDPSGNSVANGPCRVPSGRAQYHVGSGGRASSAAVPASHARCGGSGGSAMLAKPSGPPLPVSLRWISTSSTVGGGREGGGGGGSRGTARGAAAPEPQAAVDVKIQTTVCRQRTPRL